MDIRRTLVVTVDGEAEIIADDEIVMTEEQLEEISREINNDEYDWSWCMDILKSYDDDEEDDDEKEDYEFRLQYTASDDDEWWNEESEIDEKFKLSDILRK